MTQRVLVDSNVLFSKTLLDWLFHLRTHNEGLFQLYATEDILAEVLSNMREKHPGAPGHLTRRRLELMRTALDEILPDYPGDDTPGGGGFTGRDPHDFHVHSAATAGRASLLLTVNDPRDFTQSPDNEPYEVIHPDAFFCMVANSNPNCLMPITRAQLDYWNARGHNRQLDDALRAAACPTFADGVRRTIKRLAANPELPQ